MPYITASYLDKDPDFTETFSVPVIINTDHIGSIEKHADGCAIIHIAPWRKTYHLEQSFEALLEILNVTFTGGVE